MVTKSIPAAIASAVLLISASLAASPAQAEPPKQSCFGASCRDLDPSKTVCADDAQTIYEREVVTSAGSWGVLEMRYSETCHSNWVRFTPWSGMRSFLGDLAAGAQVAGKPWIWREGVSDAPRGKAGNSSLTNYEVSYWTAMVDAAGRTCMSVDVYQYGPSGQSGMGGFETDELGNYTAGCFG